MAIIPFNDSLLIPDFLWMNHENGTVLTDYWFEINSNKAKRRSTSKKSAAKNKKKNSTARLSKPGATHKSPTTLANKIPHSV
jgi:hypothetical protein